jgi:DNA-binding MarR family transcriptional regulator
VGIPGSWYEALVEIAFAGGAMRMNEFARETTLTKSGATRFVDRLERAGLVRREASPTDRRVFRLALTDEGRRVQEAADPHVLEIVAEKFGDHVTGSEAEVMLAALERARAATAGLASSP